MDFHTKRSKQICFNAITIEELAFLQKDVNSWATKDGFPYAHHCPRTFLLEENITWQKLHAHYTDKVEVNNVSHIVISVDPDFPLSLSRATVE